MEFDPAALLNQAPATALALLCILELRSLRPVIQSLLNVMSAMLERERAKDAHDGGADIVIPRVPTIRKLTPPKGNKAGD